MICLSLTFIYLGHQKVPKFDFQSQFLRSKIFVESFLIYLFFIEKYQISIILFAIGIFGNLNFWPPLFSKIMLNFWRLIWKSVKSQIKKKYFSITNFWVKIYSSWPLSLKLHHWSKLKDMLVNIEVKISNHLHYHLEVQANPKKIVPKNRCYF